MKWTMVAVFLAAAGLTPAYAEPADFETEVWGDPSERSVTVTLADLDLSDRGDAREAVWRIEAAARLVCSHPQVDLRVINVMRDYRDCRYEAIDDAIEDVEERSGVSLRRGRVTTREWRND